MRVRGDSSRVRDQMSQGLRLPSDNIFVNLRGLFNHLFQRRRRGSDHRLAGWRCGEIHRADSSNDRNRTAPWRATYEGTRRWLVRATVEGSGRNCPSILLYVAWKTDRDTPCFRQEKPANAAAGTRAREDSDEGSQTCEHMSRSSKHSRAVRACEPKSRVLNERKQRFSTRS